MRLQGNILGQAWMLDQDWLMANLLPITAFIKGEGNGAFATHQNDAESKSLVLYNYDEDYEVEEAERTVDGSANYVAIMTINHVLTKHNMSCGPRGMMDMSEIIQRWDRDDDVSSVVLRMDTPGGSASYCKVLHQTILNFSKPIYVSYSGLLCSAGYYIASAADGIYAEEPTDRAGSIGTMASWMDVQAYMEKQGVVFHEVYADQSTNKNSIMIEAYKGNYDLLKSEILNPFAEQFINDVKGARQITDAEAFTGKTYMVEEGAVVGLVDGIMDFRSVVKMAAEAGDQHRLDVSQKVESNFIMENKGLLGRIKSLFGFEPVTNKEGNVVFSEEQLETIASTLENQDVTALTDRVEKLENSDALVKLTARMDDLETENKALAGRLEVVEGEEAEEVTNTNSGGKEKRMGGNGQKTTSDNTFDQYPDLLTEMD